MDPDTARVEAYWQEFCTRCGVSADARYEAWAFGDSPEMADELLALVLTGPKRATAGLRENFHDSNAAGSATAETVDTEPLPEVGAYSVLLDGAGLPQCVIRTTDVAVKPMNQVDAAFAWDEGEGDRSLADWLNGHTRFFTRELAAKGRTFSDDMLVVLERFEVVWPEL